MRNLVTIICLSFSINLVAQLSVRNDSYIFVNDEIVFVEDYINLEESTTKLYLRNEGQLVQGSGSTGNSGIGELSVQQDGTVNQWSYNYWCSPVGNVDLNSTLNRDFRVNLIDDPLIITPSLIDSQDAVFTTSYNGISSPLTISDSWLWTYVTSSNYSDWEYVGPTGNVKTGLGFTMKGMGTGVFGNQLYEFRGKPNNGDILNTVAPAKWTLVGNPYPSAIDALDLIHDPQNTSSINGVLYYWEQQPGNGSTGSHYIADYVGGYASYTISAGGVESFTKATFITYLENGLPSALPGTISPTTKRARRYIPIGQGFMVRGVANSNLLLSNNHRVYYKESSADSEFFRSSNINSNNSADTYDAEASFYVPEDYKRFRVYVDFNDIYTRELLMNFHATATSGFDYGLEAVSPEGVASDAYWIGENIPYTIQAFNFESSLKIPLVINLNEAKSIRIRISDIQNFDVTQPIYIHDIENGIYLDLRTQDFEINLPQGNYSNRFEVTFEAETLNITEVEINSLNIFQNNNEFELTVLNPTLLDVKGISLYDINGKQVFNYSNLELQNKYRFSTKSLSDGVYVASLDLGNAKVITKKVIVKN